MPFLFTVDGQFGDKQSLLFLCRINVGIQEERKKASASSCLTPELWEKSTSIHKMCSAVSPITYFGGSEDPKSVLYL